jgi:hypothetical protein
MQALSKNIVVDKEHALVFCQPSDPVVVTKLEQRGLQHTVDNVFALPLDDTTSLALVDCGMPDGMRLCGFLTEKHPLIEGLYPAMKHQIVSALYAITHPRSYNFSECRTGKTGSLILAMDYTQRTGLVCGGWLIIATVTTLWSVWEASIKATLPHARVIVLNGKTRDALLAEPADFYITNYDSVRLSSKAFVEAVQDKRIGGCVIDEMTHIANAQSQRHKALDAVINRTNMKYVIGATGSPGCDPEAVFGMARMVNRMKLPVTTKTGWLNLTTVQYGSESWQRYPSKYAPEIIHKTLLPAIRFNKSDVIDIPPITKQDRQSSMSAEQTKMFKELEENAMTLANSDTVITAANGGVLLQKMMQVFQGFCIDNDGVAHEVKHSDRTATIIDAVQETDKKVVIFCCYKKTIEMRKQELREAGITAEAIDGSVTGKTRAEILMRFQNSDDPKVLIAHPVTTAYGVELSVADTMIFDGPPLLGGFIYQQALERLSSAKQKASNINIIRVFSSKKEKKFFQRLDEGNEMSYIVSSFFEEYKGCR